MRYVVDAYLISVAPRMALYSVIDTRHNRWVNLCWDQRKDAQDYADWLNLRATSRITPMAGVR